MPGSDLFRSRLSAHGLSPRRPMPGSGTTTRPQDFMPEPQAGPRPNIAKRAPRLRPGARTPRGSRRSADGIWPDATPGNATGSGDATRAIRRASRRAEIRERCMSSSRVGRTSCLFPRAVRAGSSRRRSKKKLVRPGPDRRFSAARGSVSRGRPTRGPTRRPAWAGRGGRARRAPCRAASSARAVRRGRPRSGRGSDR